MGKICQKNKEVQERFRRELSILSDIPRQHSGITNDDKTAHKFSLKPWEGCRDNWGAPGFH